MTDNILRYYDYNLRRRGKDFGTVDGNTWWRKNCKFYDNWVQQRFIKSADKSPILLTRHMQPYKFSTSTTLFEDGDKRSFTTAYVPDLGVFSKFEGDCCTDDELHERQKFIMLMQTREFVKNDIAHLSGKQLVEPRNSYTKTARQDELRSHLDDLYRRWADYDKLFALGWGPLPPMYRDEFEGFVAERIAKWNDPDAKRKRERAKARKTASAALGLD